MTVSGLITSSPIVLSRWAYISSSVEIFFKPYSQIKRRGRSKFQKLVPIPLFSNTKVCSNQNQINKKLSTQPIDIHVGAFEFFNDFV